MLSYTVFYKIHVSMWTEPSSWIVQLSDLTRFWMFFFAKNSYVTIIEQKGLLCVLFTLKKYVVGHVAVVFQEFSFPFISPLNMCYFTKFWCGNFVTDVKSKNKVFRSTINPNKLKPKRGFEEKPFGSNLIKSYPFWQKHTAAH